MASRKRNKFTLQKKVDLLKNSDWKRSHRLASIYAVGRTQVQNILKRKREISDSYEENGNENDSVYLHRMTT